jgi:Uma2 family endonuclease
MSSKTLVTAAELERMPDDDSVRIELDEGEIISMPPAGMEHGDMGAELNLLLGLYVKQHNLGKVYLADTGFKLSDDTVRAPDVAFVRKARLAEVHCKGFGTGAPDLAVEIFSPSDSVRQLMRKVKQYFAAGCHTVWIVYPERSEIQVLDAAGGDRLLGLGETLDAPELLPGFSASVDRIFGKS